MFFGCCNRPCDDYQKILCVEGPTDLPGQQDRAEKEELTERRDLPAQRVRSDLRDLRGEARELPDPLDQRVPSVPRDRKVCRESRA